MASLKTALVDAATVVAVGAGGIEAGLVLGQLSGPFAHNRMLPWALGRAGGMASYILLVFLVALGLWQRHPWRQRVRILHPTTRLRSHVILAVFVLAFSILHVVSLALDRYAGVGWAGVLIPGDSHYRSLPVALGVIGIYAGLVAGITAAAAGTFIGRLWWPLHRLAWVSLVLVWFHGVLSGTDTPDLWILYVTTGLAVLFLAVSRYLATDETPTSEPPAPKTPLRRAPPAGPPAVVSSGGYPGAGS